MRQRVIRALRPLDPISVENPVHPGTPYVNCTVGWIELKYAAAWPMRDSTPLRLPHFSPEQRVWLTRRWRSDQRAWLLLLVDQQWMLFPGETAAIFVGNEPRSVLEVVASKIWSPRLVDPELVRVVQPLTSVDNRPLT